MLVVLLVADSVRVDAPGFGGGPAQTPALDGLASGGTVFEHCVASGAWTVPSLTAITSGTLPHRVGVSRWRHPFPARRPTLMSAFAEAGFSVHSLVHNPRFCLAGTESRGEVGDSENPEAVLEALRAPRGADRFVFIHHWWTHLPYRNEKIPRRAWKRLCDEAIAEMATDPDSAPARMRDRYHDALGWFDSELLSRYLEAALSGGDDVLFAFTADHGETWGDSLPPGRSMEHIYDLHGRWMTDETTRVPLLLWGTGAHGPVPQGSSLGGLVRGVDVAPTLAGLAGVPWPGQGGLVKGTEAGERAVAVQRSVAPPAKPSPLQIDRGPEPFLFDGVSLVDSVQQSTPSPIREAITVTSHNALVAGQYPRSGKRMWSRFALRTAERRYVWDGLYRLREVVELGDASPPTGFAERLRDRWVDTPAVWSRLAEERASAVGPGPKLARGLFPRVGDAEVIDGEEDSEEEDASLEGAMRMLGYGE